jgi:hypothetical protein
VKYSTSLQITGTWAITSRGSITAAGSPFLYLSGDWTNNGSITVTGTSPYLGLKGTWTNNGSITAGAVATVTLGDTSNDVSGPNDIWRNAGVLSIPIGSTINLGGYFITDEFESGFQDRGVTLQLSQYTVKVLGVLDNSPADNPISRGTLALNASTGPLYLSEDNNLPRAPGVIEQGTITTSGTDDLIVDGDYSGGMLDGVTLDGTLDMSEQYARVFITGGLTLDTDLYVSGQDAFVFFRDGSTVAAGPFVKSATIHLNGNGSGLYDASWIFGINTPATLAQSITVSGENPSSFIEDYSGEIDNQGTVLQNSGGQMRFIGLVNEGSVAVASGGSITVNQAAFTSKQTAFTNEGTVMIAAGATFSTGTGDYVQSAGTTVVNGLLSAANLEIRAGLLTGSGTIRADVTNAGKVAPGDTFGTLTIQGNYTQTASGILLIQIGGANTYGQLLVTGTATLNGTLEVSFLDNYVPAAGTSFQILTFANHVGGFASELGLNLSLQPVWSGSALELVASD